MWLLSRQIPQELIEYELTAKRLRKSGYVNIPIPSKLLIANNQRRMGKRCRQLEMSDTQLMGGGAGNQR